MERLSPWVQTTCPATLPESGAASKELGPKLIGLDPTQVGVINEAMDYHLKGHPYVKSPIDMACWDILGKVSRPQFVFQGFFSTPPLANAKRKRRHKYIPGLGIFFSPNFALLLKRPVLRLS